MLVANSFDQWQRDTFFDAAEEVQHSADIMESAYRTWIRGSREEARPESLDELSRDLQMALGTAKWQLEEFERAVRLSYRNRADQITMTRHRQFVTAIEDQIHRVEAALRESFNIEGKQPFQWVNLDEKERDDLALFLSGDQGSTEDGSATSMNVYNQYDHNVGLHPRSDVPEQVGSFSDTTATSNIGSHHAVELEGSETPHLRINTDCQAEYRVNNRRTWGSHDIGKIEIVIEGKEKINNPSVLDIESASKEKGHKNSFGSPMCKDYPHGKRNTLSPSLCRRSYWLNQFLGRVFGRTQQQGTPLSSIRMMLVLMLTIFLVVPFLLYSN